MADWNKFRRALEKYYESILGPDYAEFIYFRVIEDFDRPAWYDLNAAPLIVKPIVNPITNPTIRIPAIKI